MKSSVYFVAVLFAVSCVYAHPGVQRPDDDAEVVVVPLEAGKRQNNPFEINYGEFGEPVVDTGAYPGFFSFSPFYNNPFAGFFSGLEANLARMRQEIQQILTRLPTEPDTIFSDLDKKGNTTSTVKIIDGHKVVINETVYNSDNNEGVFRIRVVEVKPEDDDSNEQEIPNRFGSDEEDNQEEPKRPEQDKDGAKTEVEDMIPTTDDKNTIEHEIDSKETHANILAITKPSDNNKLNEEMSEDSSEELVDDNFESNGWKVDNTEKWAEEKPSDHSQLSDFRPETWESVEDVPEFNDVLLTNDVESGPFEPIDLSNDILINQMMADSGAPINPDAELIEFIPNSRYMYPRFESIKASRAQRYMPIK